MKLKFKKQAYQTAAVEAVADCFAGEPLSGSHSYRIDPGRTAASPQARAQIVDEMEGFKNPDLAISSTKLVENIQAVQRRQNLPLSGALVTSKVCRINLDVEMETGTGKTYCYIKTMFELNKRYGWTKFIVVVPSIAIREGVPKSFEITADHFLEDYGKRARFFIYNSKQLHNLESFSSDAGINVMIINVQAFNATGKDARRIYEELDDFQSRRPIDVIKANRPILILDEPQKMEGTKTLDSFLEFNPLIILRYSATHKTAAQQDPSAGCAGRLQPEAGEEDRGAGHFGQGSQRHRRLSVSGIHRDIGQQAAGRARGDGDQTSKRHQAGDSQTGSRRQPLRPVRGLDQYKGLSWPTSMPVTDTVSFTNGVGAPGGRSHWRCERDYLAAHSDSRGHQSPHFEKEQRLFEQGIKVLTLFFIDEVAKYRQYDEAGEEPGEYARIFEEEYERQRERSHRLVRRILPIAKYLQGIATAGPTTATFRSIRKASAWSTRR